jgi:uncharacterized protein (TIGR03000 family)
MVHFFGLKEIGRNESMTVKKSLLAAIVAVSAVGMMTQSSNAFFGWRGGGSCGSSGGWGSRGSHGSWGGGGSWGSRGSHGGWGSHGGSWGGGSYGGGSWGGGSWGGGSYGSYGGVHYGHSDGYARTDVVYEGVVVKSSTPSTRVIASKPAVKTSLTLHVPADAKVTLAGVATKQTGEVRQFATTKLTTGQVWEDYKVVVELEKDGQVMREERVLKLTAGQPQELTVNFDSTQIAQR